MAANAEVLLASEQQRTPAPQAAPRLASLDVIRGLAVAGMILVVTPGSWNFRYPQLLHADWYGWTLADMVFPMFLFAVGMAVTLSFGSHLERGGSKSTLALKIVRRTLIILVLGLVLNLFPTFDLPNLRIPGILQRIAVCYALTACLCLTFWRSNQAARQRMFTRLAAAALVGTTPGLGVTYDPEGILSSIPAIVTVLLGVLCGVWIKITPKASQRVFGITLAGITCLLLGLALNPWIPIIKKIWTPSFVFFSGGFALLAFGCCYWLCDIRAMRTWCYPLRVLGSNSILAFTLSQLIGDYLDKPWAIRGNSFAWLHSFIPDATVASLLFAVLNLVLIIFLLAPLYHRRIFLRV